ncbi:MAG TPA: hypothetical protein VFN22_04910 [Gemmatimonadales bacterium]|nr:hypothetical protein [Gemmatimonadales bacterium]
MTTVVAALVERRPALLALRRALPGRPQRVHAARDAAHLDRILRQHRVDGVVLGAAAARAGTFAALRDDFRVIPVFCLAAVRSDDAALVRRLERAGATVLLEALDEPILERVIRQRGMTARRAAALRPLAGELDLTTPMQRTAWEHIIGDATGRLTTAGLAARLRVGRETLSRQFGAGMAPRLKLAMDAVRLAAAGELLGCRGYRVAEVAELLGYSSVSLLQRTARRLVGGGARRLGTLPIEEIVRRAVAQRPGRWT